MYRSNKNGCERVNDDPDTLTGSVMLTVTDSNDDGNLEFHVVATAASSFFFSKTQVHISVTPPGSKRPSPGQESSQCFAAGDSEPTCFSASGTSHTHDITFDTATGNAIAAATDDFYIWVHADEDTTGDTVYARSDNRQQCANTAVEEPDPDPPNGACFHGSGAVLLESGESKTLAELSLGDVIKTSDGVGNFFFSPVLTLPHAKNDELAAFLTLTTETGKKVDMTSDHFIPKCDTTLVTAGALVVGDCLLTVDGKETLVDVSQSVKAGVYTATTDDKYIVVSGFVASPFSNDSGPSTSESDYKKYRTELERERLRKLAYFKRKAKKISMGHVPVAEAKQKPGLRGPRV
jgi:hypothetical protein